MADLFKEIIPSLLEKKQPLVDEKDYMPFIVNKALSFHFDCVMYAQQMNLNHEIDKKMQYDYLLNTIRARKRPFQKWIKKEIVEDIEAVKEYYNFSDEKAQEVLPLLSHDQLNEIKKVIEKGGLNARPKRTNLGNTA